MKKIMPVFSLLLICFNGSAQTTVFDTITSGGLQRDYRMYVPASYDGSEAVPLLLNLHGYTSDNIGQALYANFNPIADTAGFVVVLPNGTYDGLGNRFWNCFVQPGIGVDDVQFISDLIDSISATYNIDPNRIYSTGMSNGGFMSHTLACELSNKIAAIASVAGSIDRDRIDYCDAQHNVPVMQIHGTADGVVPYNGNIDFLPVDSVVNDWVQHNHCFASPAYDEVPDLITTDECTAEHYVYGGCYKNITVELYKIIDGEHTWPGTLITFLGVTNQDINACKEIWAFFSRYRLDELTGIAPDDSDDVQEILIYPNPVDDVCYVSVSNGAKINFLLIYDYTGRVVFSEEYLNSDHTLLSIPELTGGIYLVEMKTHAGTYTQRLVKQ